MRIAFIVILYKTPKSDVIRLEQEIKNLGLDDYKTYFIDNTKENRGYAAAVNMGIAQAQKDKMDIFVIANPDISLSNLRGWAWLTATRYFDIFGLAMKQKGTTYYGGVIDRWRMSGGLIDKKPKAQFIPTEFVSGSFMIIKKHVINKIGLFDEHFFMYYEDADYCLRARKAGFKVGVDSKVTYTHFEQSNKNFPKKKYQLIKSRLRFLLKHGSFGQKLYELFRLPKTLIEESGTLLNIFFKNKFLVNFFSLNFSSIFNKFLNFILFIFLIRVFSPSDYGIYNVVWGFIGFFSPLLDFGTTTYGLIFLAKEKEKQFNLLNSLRFFLSIIVFLLIIVSAFILHFDKTLFFYIVLTAFTVFSNMWSGSYLILTSIKEKIFKSSITSIIYNLILISALIILVIKFKSLAYVFVCLAGSSIIFAFVNRYLIKKEINKLILSFEPENWIKILKKSYVFVLIGLSAGLYFKQDIFLLKYLKSDKDVGIYSAGYKFLEALLFVAGSYNIIVAPIFSKLKDNIKLLKRKITRDFIFLLSLGAAISISFYFLSPIVLPYVLKGNYFKSIEVARIVIFALPFIFLSSIYLNILYVFRRPFLVVFVFVFQIILNLILNLIFIPQYSYIASSYSTVICEIFNFIMAYSLARKYLV